MTLKSRKYQAMEPSIVSNSQGTWLLQAPVIQNNVKYLTLLESLSRRRKSWLSHCVEWTWTHTVFSSTYWLRSFIYLLNFKQQKRTLLKKIKYIKIEKHIWLFIFIVLRSDPKYALRNNWVNVITLLPTTF